MFRYKSRLLQPAFLLRDVQHQRALKLLLEENFYVSIALFESVCQGVANTGHRVYFFSVLKETLYVFLL
jgi:hypothetical protein